jgi:hypothetical protein
LEGWAGWNDSPEQEKGIILKISNRIVDRDLVVERETKNKATSRAGTDLIARSLDPDFRFR